MTGVEGMERVRRARQAPAARLRGAIRRMADPGRALFDPGMWPHGRIVGELLLSVVLGTLAAGIESLRNGGAAQIVAVALAAGLLLQLRRVLPGTVLLVTVVSSAAFAGLAPLTPLVGWSAGRRITGVGRATGTFALAYALSFGLELQQELPRISPAILFVGVLVTLVAI
ncbi:hypothetical protein ACWGJW_20040, partial [Streptomyces nigrescens]